MAGQLKLRRGTTSQLANFIGSEGELTYDTVLKSLVLQDGVTLGGVKIPYLSNGLVPSTMLPTATEAVAGNAKIATTAIAQAGVNDTDIITAKKLRDALNATGNAPVYACRAWVNFNGVGVVSVIASGNVSSVTDNGVGDYTLNFATPMPNANYSIAGVSSEASDETPAGLSLRMSGGATPLLKSTSAVRVSTRSTYSSALIDMSNISVQVFC